MHPFEAYLKKNNIEALQVAIKAKVRYMAVYNAKKGIPITSHNAQQIHAAALALCGTPYTGRFVLIDPIEELPTLPIKRITKHNLV